MIMNINLTIILDYFLGITNVHPAVAKLYLLTAIERHLTRLSELYAVRIDKKCYSGTKKQARRCP